MDPLLILNCVLQVQITQVWQYSKIVFMPLNKNTPTFNFLSCFKYIAHATTIEIYTLPLSFQNLVHVYLRFVSKTRILLESYL